MGYKTVCEIHHSEDGGRGSTKWIVDPHNRPHDGDGGAHAVLTDGAIGQGPRFGACSNVHLDEGVQVLQGVQSVVEHGHGLYDEPPTAGGGEVVPEQIAVDEQDGRVCTSLRPAMKSLQKLNLLR